MKIPVRQLQLEFAPVQLVFLCGEIEENTNLNIFLSMKPNALIQRTDFKSTKKRMHKQNLLFLKFEDYAQMRNAIFMHKTVAAAIAMRIINDYTCKDQNGVSLAVQVANPRELKELM
ncbi:hypothetical protein ACHAXN_005773 [Cyclotella atomus]